MSRTESADAAGAARLFGEVTAALRLGDGPSTQIRVEGDGRLQSCFAVSDLAAASIGAASEAIAELVGRHGVSPSVEVDYRLASMWFGWSLHPIGWEIPPAWDPIAGDYRTAAGWIKLHTNARRHRAAALSVLECEPTREAVARAVVGWDGDELEAAVVGGGGCAARLRTSDEWAAHPQGRAVASEPLVIWDQGPATQLNRWAPTPTRPLAGLRVLDLTRVLAGPVATRFLAGFGAEVLRIDPPDWDEPGVIPEVTLGKRCARLDLRDAANRESFAELLAGADVLVHGYRADALERLGFGPDARQQIRPGLIDVALDAYGHSGPWAHRRGFDSLVQFSSGIAAEGMRWRASDHPISLPVQALDHATGYLLAAATISAIAASASDGHSQRARLSLARTAKLLGDHRSPTGTPLAPASPDDYDAAVEQTAWGPAHRLRPPVRIAGTNMHWSRPAAELGSSPATWA